MAQLEAADGQLDWERQWRRRRDEDFEWSLDAEVAPQLQQVIEGAREWSGRALDLGCGAGTSTSYLADALGAAIGVDIATAALVQATAKQRTHGAAFATADALVLPFPPASFDFIYDRGCLQNLAEECWPGYFREVDRVARPGACFVLLVSRLLPRFPSPLTRRGLRLRYAWYVQKRRGGAQFASHDLLRSLCPTGMRIEEIDDFDFVTKKQKVRRFTYARFQKA